MQRSLSSIVAALLIVARLEGFAPGLHWGSHVAQSRDVAFRPINDRSSVLLMAAPEVTESIDDVIAELGEVKKRFEEEASEATSEKEFEQLRRKYLSKKGPVNQAMRYMRTLAPADKPKLGKVVNEIKGELAEEITRKKEEMAEKELEEMIAKEEAVDVTLPGEGITSGRRHPLSLTIERALDIFVGLGYRAVTNAQDSPEIETDYYCFEALNCPKDHPARDMQDTFYLTDDRQLMLRTHTSSVQVRQLEKQGPPLRIVAPGRVYRRDDTDATHSWMFHQVEILAVEKFGVLTLSHLKGTVDYFLKKMLGKKVKTRFRGSYFPFTCPSMEVDVFFRDEWLEVLGCGMVDPNVLEMAGVDPDDYSGFAAGFGVERFAMVTYQIKDIREFYKNDLRFLEKFPRYAYDGKLHVLFQSFAQSLSNVSIGWDNFLNGKMGEPEVDIRPSYNGNVTFRSWDELRAFNAEVTGVPLLEPVPEFDISNFDIRVGVITDTHVHEREKTFFYHQVDIGERKPRQIVSNLRPFYAPEDLTGKKVIVLSNVKQRSFAGVLSRGQILSAEEDSRNRKEIVEPPEDAQIGERVFVEGYEGPPVSAESCPIAVHLSALTNPLFKGPPY